MTYKPYAVNDRGHLIVKGSKDEPTLIFARGPSGWVTLDGAAVVNAPVHTRRADRFVAADAMRKRLLFNPVGNRSRIARFNFKHLLSVRDTYDVKPVRIGSKLFLLSLTMVWLRCVREENKARRLKARELLDFMSLDEETLDRPPTAELLQHLERNPHLIPNIDRLKHQIQVPGSLYRSPLVNELKAAKPALEAAAAARIAAQEILKI